MPDYSLIANCFEDILTTCANYKNCERRAEGYNDVLDLCGLTWRKSSHRKAGSSDDLDEVGSGVITTTSRLHRHPVRAFGGAAAVKKSSKNASETTVSKTIQAINQTLKILSIRCFKLSRQVTDYITCHGNDVNATVFPLKGNCELEIDPNQALKELEDIACEWYVLAEACVLLSLSRDDYSPIPSVECRVLQPLCDVLDKLDIFVSLGLHLQGQDSTQISAEHLSWFDFVKLQQVLPWTTSMCY